MPTTDPEQLLADLNDEQRAAVQCVRGPVVIEAGAGSGKTRVISRRAAYAAAIGAVDPNRMLLITFTEKAGAEMSQRIRKLGLPGAIANNVHSVALRQLMWLWPRVKDTPAPTLLANPYRLVNAFLRSSSHTLNPRDIVSEISWAKARGIKPGDYEARLSGRAPGVPAELAAAAFADYERRKRVARLVDFDDLLTELTALINENEDVASLVRSRRNWISVDEYQDTNHIQDALFSAWLGDSTDFCVVGDVDQAIFGFAGATPDYLVDFDSRFANAHHFELAANYRSDSAVIDVANKLLAGNGRSKRLRATKAGGSLPVLASMPDADDEVSRIVERIQKLHARGIAYPHMAILFRLNAHKLPFEAALRAADIPFTSDDPFFARREVALAIEALATPADGTSLSEVAARTWGALFGFDVTNADNAGDARWDAVNALMQIAATLEDADTTATASNLSETLRERALAEADSERGVELTTYHQAKGREWQAVFLPMLEEGVLPDFRATSSTELAEEWRLLYVGITRAEQFLWISHALSRSRGSMTFRPERSVFLVPVWPVVKPATGAMRQEPSWESSMAPSRVAPRPRPWPPAHTRALTAASVIPRGARVVHRTLGDGVVWSMNGSTISIRFGGTMRKLQWPSAATSGTLRRSTGG